MNVTLEKTGNNIAKIVVNVEAADYTDKVKKELKRFSDTHVIPGFRKGHVPMSQLRQRYGKAVKSDVINDLVYREVIKYLQENKIEILGEPLPVDVKEIGLDDTDYTFEYEVGLTPDLGITIDKSVTLPFYTIEVSDEMLKEQDEAMCRRMAAQVPGEAYEDQALVKGVLMELNEDGTVKEGEDAIQVINGILAPSYFKSKEEADKFVGSKVGDKVVFNPYASCEGNDAELSSMLNIDKEKAAEVKSNFEMAISEFIVLRPAEHNQEFFDNVFGKDKVHNEEEYKEALKSMIAGSLRGNSEQLFSRDAHNYFMAQCKDVELPAEFLKKWLVSRNEELTPENIDEEYAKMKDSLVWQLIVNHIIDTLGVEVTDEDMLGYAMMMTRNQFAQYGMTNLGDDIIADHARNILANKEYARNIHDNVLTNKMFAALEAAVTIDAKEVSLDEFKKLAEAE